MAEKTNCHEPVESRTHRSPIVEQAERMAAGRAAMPTRSGACFGAISKMPEGAPAKETSRQMKAAE